MKSSPLLNRISEEYDIIAITQLLRLRKTLQDTDLKKLQDLGTSYARQIKTGIFRSDTFENECDDQLKQAATEQDIDLGSIIKSLPKAAWNYINHHRPDLLERFNTTNESRQTILSDVIAGFFGCTV